MPLKMTPELNNVFRTCNEATLSPKVTHLVTLAAQLARRQGEPAQATLGLSRAAGASLQEISRVACLCSCAAGATVQDTFVNLLRSPRMEATAVTDEIIPTGILPAGILPAAAIGPSQSLDTSVFRTLRLCSSESLDKKTTHLVGLAACLASGCVCARGHIIQARIAGATEEELARCACIASCVAGIRNKFSFLEAVQDVGNCTACAC